MTSSIDTTPVPKNQPHFRREHERIFGAKKKTKPGYTIIRYVGGKKVEVNNCEDKSRREVGLAPLKVEGI